ncbi:MULTISPECIES: thiamine phosphate synthase [Shouchella]|uniref:Thiamine-phosphate synthase n=2 Tax=Shouchella TaxID=2893057 RepID=A0ABY7W6E6_9BACI|nr:MULTISPECIES: thiamine phosphate synthase [Shouchella]MED4127940.1 thiamine phosphate synthase [Shouchella miscanthi]WDF03086.1 thiamine phosphate synthase [Shouchella hunanensis]GAF24025.1 thiamin-phosphate pyrophosphorylase [Bacillus sp. JCM 19047]
MKDFQLYVITGEAFHKGKELVTVMEDAIKGGADFIQLRDKTSSRKEVFEKAKQLKELCRSYEIPFIVNDYIDIAMAVDADGVHVGQDDMPLAHVRKLVGDDKIIGVSTHKLEEALEAERGGADYIGVGPIFKTNSKEDVVDPVTTSYIKEIKANLSIPFVAIGGIKTHNVREVIEAGADAVCVITEVVAADDVQAAAERLTKAINEAKA